MHRRNGYAMRYTLNTQLINGIFTSTNSLIFYFLYFFWNATSSFFFSVCVCFWTCTSCFDGREFLSENWRRSYAHGDYTHKTNSIMVMIEIIYIAIECILHLETFVHRSKFLIKRPYITHAFQLLNKSKISITSFNSDEIFVKFAAVQKVFFLFSNIYTYQRSGFILLVESLHILRINIYPASKLFNESNIVNRYVIS